MPRSTQTQRIVRANLGMCVLGSYGAAFLLVLLGTFLQHNDLPRSMHAASAASLIGLAGWSHYVFISRRFDGLAIVGFACFPFLTFTGNEEWLLYLSKSVGVICIACVAGAIMRGKPDGTKHRLDAAKAFGIKGS